MSESAKTNGEVVTKMIRQTHRLPPVAHDGARKSRRYNQQKLMRNDERMGRPRFERSVSAGSTRGALVSSSLREKADPPVTQVTLPRKTNKNSRPVVMSTDNHVIAAREDEEQGLPLPHNNRRNYVLDRHEILESDCGPDEFYQRNCDFKQSYSSQLLGGEIESQGDSFFDYDGGNAISWVSGAKPWWKSFYEHFFYNNHEFTTLQQNVWATLIGAMMGVMTALWGWAIELCVDFVWETVPEALLEWGIFTDLDGARPLPHYMWVCPAFFGGILSYISAMIKIPGQNEWIDSLHSVGILDFSTVLPLFLISTAGMASGLSLGPELPLVLTGGMFGSYFGKYFGQTILSARVIHLTAASAAIAGFFGFPMAGALFVLELPHRMGLQYFEAFSPATLASIIAVLVNRMVTQDEVKGYFEYPFLKNTLPSHVFYIAIIYGVVGSGIGVTYCKGCLFLKNWVHHWFNHHQKHGNIDSDATRIMMEQQDQKDRVDGKGYTNDLNQSCTKQDNGNGNSKYNGKNPDQVGFVQNIMNRIVGGSHKPSLALVDRIFSDDYPQNKRHERKEKNDLDKKKKHSSVLEQTDSNERKNCCNTLDEKVYLLKDNIDYFDESPMEIGFFQNIMIRLISNEQSRATAAGTLAGGIVGVICMFIPHLLFWGEAQLQTIIDRGKTPLPVFSYGDNPTAMMTKYGYCMIDHDGDSFDTVCAGIITVGKILVIGLSLGTGIVGGHFWGPLYVGCAGSHFFVDMWSKIGFGSVISYYPCVAMICIMGSAHTVIFRAHMAIMLILTLSINSFSSTNENMDVGDYSAIFPLLVVACFISLQLTKECTKFYTAQRCRGDINAIPEALCKPFHKGSVVLDDLDLMVTKSSTGDGYDYNDSAYESYGSSSRGSDGSSYNESDYSICHSGASPMSSCNEFDHDGENSISSSYVETCSLTRSQSLCKSTNRNRRDSVSSVCSSVRSTRIYGEITNYAVPLLEQGRQGGLQRSRSNTPTRAQSYPTTIK